MVEQNLGEGLDTRRKKQNKKILCRGESIKWKFTSTVEISRLRPTNF